jgi:hypothetical protein
MPLKETTLVPWVAPKFVPLMVNVVERGPEVGETVMFATWVKATPLLATPPTVTTTLPFPGLPNEGTVILVSLQLVGVRVKPPNCTTLVPCVAPKFNPLTMIGVPVGPHVGEID